MYNIQDLFVINESTRHELMIEYIEWERDVYLQAFVDQIVGTASKQIQTKLEDHDD